MLFRRRKDEPGRRKDQNPSLPPLNARAEVAQLVQDFLNFCLLGEDNALWGTRPVLTVTLSIADASDAALAEKFAALKAEVGKRQKDSGRGILRGSLFFGIEKEPRLLTFTFVCDTVKDMPQDLKLIIPAIYFSGLFIFPLVERKYTRNDLIE